MATYNTIFFVGLPLANPRIEFVYVERGPTSNGPWTRIGQASVDNAGPVGPYAYYYDNTAPFDTPVWYRAIAVDTGGVEVQVGVPAGPFTLASSGFVVVSDPLRPWADLEFGFCATPQNLAAAACAPNAPDLIWSRFGSRLSRSDAGLFDILDAERPADVYARRKEHSGSFLVATKTLDAIGSMYDLFTAGGPVYLRAPAEYGTFDFAIQPGDIEQSYLTDQVDQRQPFRLWTVPYVVVDLPLGPQQGAANCTTWCAVKATNPTFADLTAQGGTWAGIADGTTLALVCPAP